MSKRIIKICNLIQALTTEEITEMEVIANRQAQYIHPLKQATQAKQNALGEHNQRVMKDLRKLYETLKRSEGNL